MPKIVTLLSCLFSCLFFSAISLAGKGDGAGGGPTLTEAFDRAKSGSLYLLVAPAQECPFDNGCSVASIAWIDKNRDLVRKTLNAYQLSWIKENETQNSCVVVTGNLLKLSAVECRPIVLQRKDALRELFTAVFSNEPFKYTKAQSEALLKCLVETLDANFWNYAWVSDDVKGAVDDITKRIGRIQNNRTAVAKERLEALLKRSREIVVRSLRNWEQAKIPSDIDSDLTAWLLGDENKVRRWELARDVENTPYTFTEDPKAQKSPAFTHFNAFSAVQFSMPLCMRNIESKRDAMQTIVHESTHHSPFLIEDELMADRIGTLVAKIIEGSPSSLYETEEERRQSNRKTGKDLDAIINQLNGK